MTVSEAIATLKAFGAGVAWVPSLRQWHLYVDVPPSDRRSEYLSDGEIVARAEELLAQWQELQGAFRPFGNVILALDALKEE